MHFYYWKVLKKYRFARKNRTLEQDVWKHISKFTQLNIDQIQNDLENTI